MKNSMLIVVMSLIFIISLIGCSHTDYDYKEEEASKLVHSDESNPSPLDKQTDLIKSPQTVDVLSDVSNNTLCDSNNLLLYGYELRLNKAVCYFAIPNFAYFENLVFTIEEYDEEGNLINTVLSEKMHYVGTYVAKVVFPSDEDVSSIKICEYAFTSTTNKFDCSNLLTLDNANEIIELKPLSNTTFQYDDCENHGVILLDDNGVQIDMLVFDEDKGQFVTKQGVSYYKVIKFE